MESSNPTEVDLLFATLIVADAETDLESATEMFVE